MHVPYYFLYKKVHFEKVTKGTPLGGFLSKNNVHVSTQLINTLSPPGLILLIISAIFCFASCINYMTILWIPFQISWIQFCGFLLFIWGGRPSPAESTWHYPAWWGNERYSEAATTHLTTWVYYVMSCQVSGLKPKVSNAFIHWFLFMILSLGSAHDTRQLLFNAIYT